MKRFALIMSLIAICVFAVSAQMPGGVNPVTWKFSVKMKSASEGEVVMKATVADGWHLYGFTQPEDGPIPTTIDLTASTGVKFTSDIIAKPTPRTEKDPLMGTVVNYWEKTVTIIRPFKVTDRAKARIKGSVRFMACNGETCMPPATQEIDLAVKK